MSRPPRGYYQDAEGQWWADAKHGRRVRRHADSEAEAKALYHDIMHALQHGLPLPKQRGGPKPREAPVRKQDNRCNVREAFEGYVLTLENPNTRYNVERVAARWIAVFGGLLVDDLAQDEIMRVRKERADATCNRTANQDVDWLRAAIKLAIRSRRATFDATAGLKPLRFAKRKVHLRKGQGEAILAALTDPQDRRLVVFIANVGLRRENACSIEWAWVDWAEQLLTVPRTKGGDALVIPLNSIAVQVLRLQHAVTGHQRYVWLNSWGRVMKGMPWWRRHLRPALERCGIIELDGKMPAFRTHDLRHSFASRGAQAGVDIQARKELLGHSSVGMTEQYTHFDVEDLREASEALAWRPEDWTLLG